MRQASRTEGVPSTNNSPGNSRSESIRASCRHSSQQEGRDGRGWEGREGREGKSSQRRSPAVGWAPPGFSDGDDTTSQTDDSTSCVRRGEKGRESQASEYALPPDSSRESETREHQVRSHSCFRKSTEGGKQSSRGEGAGGEGRDSGSYLGKVDAWSTPFLDVDKVAAIDLMIAAIKYADLGHVLKPLRVHVEWSRRITREFYELGDFEKRHGVPVSPLCDREKDTSIAKSQVSAAHKQTTGGMDSNDVKSYDVTSQDVNV